jgi:hypothetical protein
MGGISTELDGAVVTPINRSIHGTEDEMNKTVTSILFVLCIISFFYMGAIFIGSNEASDGIWMIYTWMVSFKLGEAS